MTEKANAFLLAGLFFLASGIASGVADIASTPAKFRTSAFARMNPDWQYGEYLGHKDQTWVNKWARNEAGEVMAKTERFFLSSTALVGLTDLWHGARALMLFFIALGAMIYPNPGKWWQYFTYYALIALCYSSGWHGAETILG